MPSTNKKLAVYLPASERYSSIEGGALATWTYRIYNSGIEGWDVAVFGKESKTRYQHPPLNALPPGNTWETAGRWMANRHFRGHVDWLKLYISQHHARTAARRIRTWDADVIHVHNDPLAVIALRKYNPSAGLILHMNNDHIATIKRHFPDAIEIAIEIADQIVCCSKFILNSTVQAFPFSARKLSTFPNGADAVEEHAIESRISRLRETQSILFVGRLVPDKGIDILVEAMKTVLAVAPRSKLKIVGGANFGDNSQTEYISALKIAAQPLGKCVEFTGPVAKDDVAAYLEDADVFVCPSIWDDPFPLVNLEAMGAGIPVIAFAKGGIPEAIGDAGILLNETNPQSLANAIIAVLQDRSLAEDLSRLGHKRVTDNFHWELLADSWGKCLQTFFQQKIGLRRHTTSHPILANTINTNPSPEPSAEMWPELSKADKPHLIR